MMRKSILCIMVMMTLLVTGGCRNEPRPDRNVSGLEPDEQRTDLKYDKDDDGYHISLTKEQVLHMDNITYSILCEDADNEGFYYSIVSGLEPEIDESVNDEGVKKVYFDKEQSLCAFYAQEEEGYVPISRMEYEEGHWKTEYTGLSQKGGDISTLLCTKLDIVLNEKLNEDLLYTLEQRDHAGINPNTFDYALDNWTEFNVMESSREPKYDEDEKISPFNNWEDSIYTRKGYDGCDLADLIIQEKDIFDFNETYVMQAVLKLKDGTEIASDLMPLQERTEEASAEESVVENEQGEFRFKIVGREAVLMKYAGKSKEINVPEKVENYEVTGIDSDAFLHAEDMVENISLPDTIKTIEQSTFSNLCKLQTLDLGEGIKSLDEGAICYCTKLKELYIPKSLTDMDEGAILGCEVLENITVAQDNPSFEVENGALLSKDGTVLYVAPTATSGTYIVPDTVEVIGRYAFYECYGITEVVFPDNLKRINAHAFEETVLQTITLPESLQYIGDNAFSAGISGLIMDDDYFLHEIQEIHFGSNLEWIGEGAFTGLCVRKFTVDEQNPYFMSSDDGLVLTKDGTFLLLCPTGMNGELNVPEGVENIAERCFEGNGSFDEYMENAGGIRKINLPVSLKYFNSMYLPENIEELHVCSVLDEWENASGCDCMLTISGNSNYKIEGNALYNQDETVLMAYVNNTEEDTFVFLETVREVDVNAFVNSGESLKKIVIPEKAVFEDMEIGKVASVFSGIFSLSDIEVDEKNPVFCSAGGVLFDKERKNLLVYPTGKEDTEYVIPEGVERVSVFALNDRDITKITVPSTLKAFHLQNESESYCLTGLYNLKEIEIAADNPYMAEENSVVYSKTTHRMMYITEINAPTVVIPDGITTVGEGVFDYLMGSDEKPSDIYFPDSLTSIQDDNFNGVTSYDQWDSIAVHIPSSVTEISENSFQESPGIELYVPEGSYAAQFAEEHGMNYVMDSQ